MNILIINYEYPPLGGGGGVFSRDLAEELAKNNDVDVLTTHFKGLKKEETVNGVNIHRVWVPGRRSLYSATMVSLLFFPLSGAIKGLRLLRKKKYDIINTHFAVPTGPAGLALSALSGIPNILNLPGGDIYDPSKKTSPHRHALLRWTVRNIINRASKVITESTNIANYAKKFYKPSKDITVIPLGIPEPGLKAVGREELDLKKDGLYLVSVGRLVKRKGYDFLIKALSLLRKETPEIDLILIGDGPERGSLEKLSDELEISGRIIFPGAVSDEEKLQYLAASDIYVLSSLHEGFGIVLLEAMFCGLPIIATNEGGQTDFIKDGSNGLLVSPADAKALADAISGLAADADRRHAMGGTNKEAAKQYNISSIANRYAELFHGIITQRETK